MIPRTYFLVVFGVLLLSCLVSPWRRRRRRRAPPPPPVHCKVSSWSSWGTCSEKCKIGTYTRHRTITTPPTFGGSSCPTTTEKDDCGEANGGCDDQCLSGGTCACINPRGYELQADGKSCADKNECVDAGSGHCVNSNCRNTDGDYECDCLPGYQPSSNRRECEPKSCTPLTAPQCPADAYRDVFGPTCTAVSINCLEGYKYQKSCALTCPENYQLAVITQPSSGQTFAQDFTTVDFNAPSDRTVCKVNSGAVEWDWNPLTTPYYCRRVNDPPVNTTLSDTSINEREPFFKSVGELTAPDPQKDHVTFRIVNPEGNFYFLIQGNKLVVKTRIVWNPDSSGNDYPVVINASDNGSPQMSSVTRLSVTVLNINDPPRDLELSNNEVFENVPINYTVGNLTAIDNDIGPHRISNFSWEIVDSDNGFFSLRRNQVLVAKSLDHETRDIHRIQVRCTDFGLPRKSSPDVSMIIIVRDSNDSLKYINLTQHAVAENSPLGHVVGHVIARDDDNDTLLFDLNGTDRKVLEKFSLQGAATCGLSIQGGKEVQTCSVPLIVNGSLDYELENEYIIWVAVTDPGGVTRKRFTIEVENVNERSTDILITYDKVAENSPGGTVVGEFLVKDPDNKDGVFDHHSCSLVNSLNGDEDVFYITQRLSPQRIFLRVKANEILDFETKTLYNITVSCKDSLDLGISKSFLIEITDVNEQPSSILLSSTSVHESSSSLIFICSLSAEDPEGLNQTFIYTVRNSDSFRIVNQDELFLLGPLDFELTPSISVHLRVTDDGGLYLEKIFTISVQDMNDAPSDITLQPNSTLSENSVENVFISGVEMIDQDRDTKPSCRLLNSSNDRVKLTESGLNLLVGPTNTDYESLDSSKTLKILLNCSDQHGASVKRWISLPVEDVNEAPTNLNLSKLEIRENKNDTLVGILEITDPDVGQLHSCSILDEKSSFYIDSSANPPTLRTAEPLDFESLREHSANIRCEDIVQDHRQAQHATTEEFKINVIDVNETPLILCDTPFHVSPSFSRGSIIGQIQNYDPDNEHYHRSKKNNSKGPFEIRKQLLNYRWFPENNYTWPFDITVSGIIYLEKQLSADDYNGSIIVVVRVDDDGAVLERNVGFDGYGIKKDETKYSVHQCSVLISANEADIDIHLSSNTIHENATNGTMIGRLSRSPLLDHEDIKYHIIEQENDTQPFEIDGDVLKLKLDNSLDYETLPTDKTFPITVSSIASISGVFTKRFLIQILDVNEMPTEICLTSPRPLDDCSVVGHILIEDMDYPKVQCGNSTTADLEKISSKLSEYTCHVQEGEDTLSNTIVVDNHFYIQDLTLYVNKTIFTQGDGSYNVPIVCRSTQHALHILSTTLNVDIEVSSDPSCRHGDRCKLCPQPTFCLTHVQVAGTCVDKDYRINSTVGIPVSIFEKPGFVFMFENYVTSLIEGKSQGKTLLQLVQDFNNQNEASQRRRRETPYDNVYVEQFLYSGQGASTNVVFAVAEKPSYDLILASDACQLLKDSEVKCVADGSNTSADTGDAGGESAFPFWIIYVIAGLIVVAFIVSLVVMKRRKRNNRSDNSAVVHFSVRDGNQATVDSMYETPVDGIQGSLSHSGTSNPTLVEKRKDIKVFHNPTYRSKETVKLDSDSDPEETESKKKTLPNHYETANPVPIYETIDDNLYEKVNEEKKQHEATSRVTTQTVDTKHENKKRKKSRTNPVYDIGEDDDELNPVVNLAVTSPSRKAKQDDAFFNSEEDEDDFDDSMTAQILSTFQTKEKPMYENVGVANPSRTDHVQPGVGVVNPLHAEGAAPLHTSDVKVGMSPLHINNERADVGVNPLYTFGGVKANAEVVPVHTDDVQAMDEGDSKPPIRIKNELYPLEHQSSFETKPDGHSSC